MFSSVGLAKNICAILFGAQGIKRKCLLDLPFLREKYVSLLVYAIDKNEKWSEDR